MKDDDIVRVIGATVLAAAVAILMQEGAHESFQATAFGPIQTGEGQSVSHDRFRMQWDRFQGDLQKQWSAFTAADLRRIDGDYGRFVDLARVRYANQDDAVQRWTDEWYARSSVGPLAKTDIP